MKRLILFLSLLLPSTAWCGITISSYTILGTGASPVTTGSIDSTGANLIVVNVNNLNAHTPVVTDNKGNTYTGLTASGANGNQQSQLFYSSNAVTGTGHTITVSGSSLFPSVSVLAIAGALVSDNPFDQQSAAETATATTQLPGSITPGQNNEIVITGLGFNAAGLPVSIGSSFTMPVSVEFNASNYGGAMAYKIQTTAAAVNPLWTRTNSDDMSATIASFKEAPITPAVIFTTGSGSVSFTSGVGSVTIR